MRSLDEMAIAVPSDKFQYYTQVSAVETEEAFRITNANDHLMIFLHMPPSFLQWTVHDLLVSQWKHTFIHVSLSCTSLCHILEHWNVPSESLFPFVTDVTIYSAEDHHDLRQLGYCNNEYEFRESVFDLLLVLLFTLGYVLCITNI